MNKPEYVIADTIPLHIREYGMPVSFPTGTRFKLDDFLIEVISTNPKKNTISFKVIAIEKPKKGQKHDNNASNQNAGVPGVGTPEDANASTRQPEVGDSDRN